MPILIFSVLGLILYSLTLHAPFTFDDQFVIIHNPLIQNLSQGWQGVLDVWSFQHSRFLTNLTFAINFYFNHLDTFGYHLVNLIIHLLTVLGVWFFVRLLLRINGEEKPYVDVALWTALIFLVHPLNTESVSYIGQRSSALVAMFYIWSVICYIQASIVFDRYKTFVFLGSAVLLATLAVLSKETALTLPLALMLVDYFLVKRK